MISDLLNTCPGGAESQGFAGVLFTQLISWLLNLQCDLGNPNIYPKDQTLPSPEYDFIVVGAGSTGSVIASRLTEIPELNVLLVESGGDPTATSDVPALSLFTDDHDWKYMTEPEPGVCEGFKNKQCFFKRGKGMGGSSLLNFPIYIRGNRQDFNQWEKRGNPGWRYNKVLKYFKKSEDMRIPELIGSEYHQTGGYVGLEKVNDPEYFYIVDLIEDAAKKMGLPTGHDINGKSQTGFSEVPAFITNGTRRGTARAFLSPVRDRPNLHVMKNAHVTKLLTDGDKQVNGIEVKKNGTYFTIKSKKEVIVSAGTLNSPQLLMLSGIGPKEHLKELGINVIKDLRVGDNLRDHLLFLGTVIALEPFNITDTNNQTKNFDSYYEYVSKRSGGFSKLKSVMYMGFIETTDNKSGWPEIQVYNFYFTKNDSTLTAFLNELNFDSDYYSALTEYNQQYDLLLFCPTLIRPKSFGKVLLKNTDPFTYPKIYKGYLKMKEDVNTILRSVRFIDKFIQTDSMKSRNAFLVDIKYQNCKDYEFGTDEYWECSMKQVGSTCYHTVGTCKMGPFYDRTAVVDSRLRVHGINGLRVADSSIMPQVVSGNTHAASMMIGEKVSDLIKEDWKYKKEEL